MAWNPKRTLEESDMLLTSPGSIHETETILIDGRLQRVYKNLWPSLKEFWLTAVSQYSPDTYIVYEDLRLTYLEVHNRALKVAGMFRDIYAIKKGDRVAICSRNCPEYLVVFWACHLIGAVVVLANAWLPLEPLSHCLIHTGCRLVIFDVERAARMQPAISRIKRDIQAAAFLVFGNGEQCSRLENITSFQGAISRYKNDGKDILCSSATIEPEDNASIIFTSGTTGAPKGVLSTQRQFLTNVLNVLVGGFRASLRGGNDCPLVQRSEPQKAALVAVPLFHVTGSTSFSMLATMTGMKIVMTRKWDVEEAVGLIKRENITVAGGVPSMVADLIQSSLVGHPLEGLLFGGAPAPDSLVPRARQAFPTATMSQGYGLTETNSIAVSVSGEDYITRPTTTGRASPVNEIRIVRNDKCVPPGSAGEVWLRGPNVMKEYWHDKDATNAVITRDGWLKTGDVGYVDSEGFLYIKDRLKDIIIRGGENVDSVTVENALYADPRVSEAAAVGVPDERLGELVAAIVSVRPGYKGELTEEMLLENVQMRLPRFAVPVMIVILKEPFEHTPSGKIIKGELRKIVRRHWELRRGSGKGPRQPLANL